MQEKIVLLIRICFKKEKYLFNTIYSTSSIDVQNEDLHMKYGIAIDLGAANKQYTKIKIRNNHIKKLKQKIKPNLIPTKLGIS